VHIENARHEGNDLRGLGRVLELVNKEVNVVLSVANFATLGTTKQ
jgi:hypothetical protein